MYRYRALIATAFACVGLLGGVSKAAQPPASTGCLLGLPLKPADCARLMRLRPTRKSSSWISKDTGSPLIYGAEPFQSLVTVSAITGDGLKAAGEITFDTGEAPSSVTVDAAQNLYVAVAPYPRGKAYVAVYPRGSTRAIRKYEKGLTGPVSVAVDARGTVYVLNVANIGNADCVNAYDGAEIVEYAKGSTTPTGVLRPLPECSRDIAVDANSNLFVSWEVDPNPGIPQDGVSEFAHGSRKANPLKLDFPGEHRLYNVAFDSAGNLLVASYLDDFSVGQILAFAHNKGTPITTIQYGGYWSAKGFAMFNNRVVTTAYVAEPFPSAAVAMFDYPSGRELYVQNPPAPYYYEFAVSAGTKAP